MSGKVVLVTGATDGIGKATACALAAMGATVVLAGRNRAKGEQVRAELQKQTGNKRLDLLIADLSVQAEVRALAQQYKERYHRLDVLVNNAGAVYTSYQRTVDGIELTWALNHLGYFLLTDRLLGVLKASVPSRIVNVASDASRFGRLDFAPRAPRRYNGLAAYGRSKRANIVFTYELARRLAGTGVTVNAMAPGGVATQFGQNNHGPVAWAYRYGGRFMRTPEEGADTVIWLAASPDLERVSGRYFRDRRAVTSVSQSYDEETQRAMWEQSERLTRRGQQ